MERSAEELLAKHRDEWMALPGVIGTAVGLADEEICLKVYLTRRTPEVDASIPDRVDGYRVVLEETGGIRPW